MARELSAEAQAEKDRIKNEKKLLKDQRKEVKKRAKEIAEQEEALGDEGGNGFVTFAATLFIIILWLAVICVIVKLDIGGFGSSVLRPILKDVPVVKLILPGTYVVDTDDPEEYGGFSSMEEAVDYIKQLELEIERIQTASNSKDSDLETLRAEVERLRAFESAQVEFQRIQGEFYDEVVYSDKGPGAEEYRKWYEEMNPATAESIYRQVVAQQEESTQFAAYVDTFAKMKPKSAAQGLEELLGSDIKLAGRILQALSTDDRAAIMDQMSAESVARLAKIMDPES